jgi:hypothetical protein
MNQTKFYMPVQLQDQNFRGQISGEFRQVCFGFLLHDSIECLGFCLSMEKQHSCDSCLNSFEAVAASMSPKEIEGRKGFTAGLRMVDPEDVVGLEKFWELEMRSLEIITAFNALFLFNLSYIQFERTERAIGKATSLAMNTAKSSISGGGLKRKTRKKGGTRAHHARSTQ